MGGRNNQFCSSGLMWRNLWESKLDIINCQLLAWKWGPVKWSLGWVRWSRLPPLPEGQTWLLWAFITLKAANWCQPKTERKRGVKIKAGGSQRLFTCQYQAFMQVYLPGKKVLCISLLVPVLSSVLKPVCRACHQFWPAIAVLVGLWGRRCSLLMVRVALDGWPPSGDARRMLPFISPPLALLCWVRRSWPANMWKLHF